MKPLIRHHGHGWKGSLPEHELRARVAGVERMLIAPMENAPLTVPGLFAGEPSREVVELLDAVAADVRSDSARVALGAIAAADLRDVLARVAVPTLLVWANSTRVSSRAPFRRRNLWSSPVPVT
jgi:hypothetical protein